MFTRHFHTRQIDDTRDVTAVLFALGFTLADRVDHPNDLVVTLGYEREAYDAMERVEFDFPLLDAYEVLRFRLETDERSEAVLVEDLKLVPGED